jgi:hypothetical protein
MLPLLLIQNCRDTRHGVRVDRSQARETGAFRDISLEIELHCPWLPMRDW